MKKLKNGKIVYLHNNRQPKGFNIVSLGNLQRAKPVAIPKAERDLIEARLYNPDHFENDEL